MKPDILKRAEAAGHVTFDSGDYDLNLIGVRTSSRISNVFDDQFHCVYLEQGQWVELVWPCTTDAGTYWIENPIRVEGTAILKAGQYRSAWQIGTHRGYEALSQCQPVTVWRDANKDAVIDHDHSQTGLFSINIHRASSTRTSSQVDKWSAGCQVIANPAHFQTLMSLCHKQVTQWGWSKFSYTLLED